MTTGTKNETSKRIGTAVDGGGLGFFNVWKSNAGNAFCVTPRYNPGFNDPPTGAKVKWFGTVNDAMNDHYAE
jgi:hypothetical protein